MRSSWDAQVGGGDLRAWQEPSLTEREQIAMAIGRAAGALSRFAGTGSGDAIEGRVALGLAPKLLTEIGRGRRTALVSGTNGKTTTTRMLREIIAGAFGERRVVSNERGANLPTGIVSALADNLSAPYAVLEVDEGYLGMTMLDLHPEVVVLLNLSRDQLDRVAEVRKVALRWHDATQHWLEVRGGHERHLVANCDDPLVAWAAGAGSDNEQVIWVAAGSRWHGDATSCPACGSEVLYRGADWWCRCGLHRPDPSVWVDGPWNAASGDPPEICWRAVPGDAAGKGASRDGEGGARQCLVLPLPLPGAFNAANAAMAVAAGQCLGVPKELSIDAISKITAVAGRYEEVEWCGIVAHLLLAKNPAGWAEIIELVCAGREDSVLLIAVNAEVADGRDPSWLWDVPFERLRGRTVVATGTRAWDLGVRLSYAEVDHEVMPQLVPALRMARHLGSRAEVMANYTAFQRIMDVLGVKR